MKFSTVLILCLDVLAQQDSIDGGISGTPFYSCQTADSIFTLESLTLDPYPIPIGATLVSTSRGVLKQPIKQGARLNVLGKLGFLTGNIVNSCQGRI